MSYAPRRLALLAACVSFVACASAPEPKATPKRKKHKKHDSDVAEKHKKTSDEDEDRDKPDRPDKSDKKKKKVADASEDEEEIKVSDDDEDSSTKKKASKKKKAADEKADEEKQRKQREKEEKAEREKEKAAEREREKAAEREKKEEAEREKKEAAEREKEEKAEREKEAKAKKKQKKASEDEAEADSDEVASKPAKTKGKAAKKKTEDSEEVATEVDMTGDGDGESEEVPREKTKKGKAAKAKAAAKTKTAARTKASKGTKKKTEEDESAEANEDAEVAEPEAEQPVSDDKPARTGKAGKPKLAKAAAKPAKEKPAKEKPAKPDKTEDEGPVIDMEGDTGGDTEEPERRVAAIDVPGVNAENEEPDVGAAKSSGEPVAVTASPNSLNDRPLTLAADKLEVHGGLRVNSITLPGAMGAPDIKKTSEGLAIGVAYGLGDKAEVGADYTILVNPGTVKGPITFHGAYRAYVTPKLEIAAAAAFAIDFDTLKDPVTMKESTVTYAALDLGAWTRYRLGHKLSLISGLPATPSSAASLSKLAFALPPIPYQLAIGLNNDGPIALDLPIGAGYQATGSLYALVMTDLAHFGIAHSPNAFLFKDFIPLSIGGFYVIDKLDIGLVFSDDFKKDTLRFDTVIRYSIK